MRRKSRAGRRRRSESAAQPVPAFRRSRQYRLLQKTQGREAHIGTQDVYEYWYESEIQFPDGYEAKCAEEKERGPCALLGIAADQSFQKNEILKSEGSLHFSKTEKGWAAEDKSDY